MRDIIVRLKKEKGAKNEYDNGLIISNPFRVFSFCRGKDFIATVPLEYIMYVISSFRKGMGITEQEIGDAMGKYHKIINDIEMGTETISIKDLMFYVDRLGLEIEVTIKPKSKNEDNRTQNS